MLGTNKKSYLTVTDQFCGAGGSSQGADAALRKVGITDGIKLALNHWDLAIETHSTNFPFTQHDCTDISASDPRRYFPTDILITTPECTNHSVAKGQKNVKKQIDLFISGKLDPAAERSRATMWDVPRFAEYHKYNAIVVENVVDARNWVMFDSWLHAMHSLGYHHRCLYLNSMHFHPTPQSRDRMYVVFWRKGNKPPVLDYRPIANCQKCGKTINAVQVWKRSNKKFGKYDDQYVYCCPSDGTIVTPYTTGSYTCIDWSDLGTQIGCRKKPLCNNTLNRIKQGLERFNTTPFVIKTENTSNTNNVRSIFNPFQTQTTRQTNSLCIPSTIRNAFLASYYSSSVCLSHITAAMGTLTTGDRHGLVSYSTPSVEDCYYRVLNANEVKLGMGFNRDYVVLGDSKKQVKQLGNAVTPPVMEWIIDQIVESLN
jgi:DNA (cytosine-5)-methyltransferase 1